VLNPCLFPEVIPYLFVPSKEKAHASYSVPKPKGRPVEDFYVYRIGDRLFRPGAKFPLISHYVLGGNTGRVDSYTHIDILKPYVVI